MDKPKPSSSARMFESNEFDKWLGREEDQPRPVIADSSPVIKALDFADVPEQYIPEGDSWPNESTTTARRGAGRDRADDEVGPRIAILVAASLLVSFALGIVVGRYVVPKTPLEPAKPTPVHLPPVDPLEPKEVPQAEIPTADRHPTLVGTMRYRNAAGEAFDAGAAVIVFPQDEKMQTKIPSEGLRPEHRSSQNRPGVEMIRSHGGEIGYVKEDGSFSLPVDRPGKYWVLVISNRMKRGEDQGIFAGDRPILSQFFADVDGLLAGREYLLVSRHVPEGVAQSVQHCFVDAK